MSSKERKLLVVAIDLGTDYSVYGFSLRHEYQTDPTKISLPVSPVSSTNSLSLKQPTCVLCNPAGQFDSFGYEAEDKYSELSQDKEHYKWYFFRNIIHMLSMEQVDMGFALTDEKGLKMPARKVFSMAIRYFKDVSLNGFEKRGMGIKVDDIHWVFPVPTIWTVFTKDFLREAAKEAGIDEENLTIVLKPDAATVYCQLLTSDRISCGGRFDDDKYMVIDLGESNADFTVHEKQPNETIKEVHKASGGAWGSNIVNQEFHQMIIKIVGTLTFQRFYYDNLEDVMMIRRDLECKKRSIGTDYYSKICINIPIDLGEKVQDAIKQTPYKGITQRHPDQIILEADLFRSLFKKCISNITNHIEILCQKPGVKGTSTFLMIGNFSEYPLVQEAVLKAFPKVKVVIPYEPGLAVVKGAVILGHKFGLTYDYNFQLQQPTSKDTFALAATFAKRDEDDVSSDNYANGATCSSSSEQGIRKDQIRKMKNQTHKDKKSLSEEGEEALSSDFLEISIQTQDKSTKGLETQLKNQTTLKADNTRAPSDDELFALSRQMKKR